MSFIDTDLRAMYNGPLARNVSGPDGVIRGFFDEVDEEFWRLGLDGRAETRLDRHSQICIQTCDVGSIDNKTNKTLITCGVTYHVRDKRRKGDGRETMLLVVEA